MIEHIFRRMDDSPSLPVERSRAKSKVVLNSVDNNDGMALKNEKREASTRSRKAGFKAVKASSCRLRNVDDGVDCG